MKPRRTSLLRVEELERREVLSVNPSFAAGPFPTVPGSLSAAPAAHSIGPLAPTPFQLTQTIPDLRGTYNGPSTSPVTGRTDQFTLQIEQQANGRSFKGVALPDRRGVSMQQIQQQLGNNFPWAVLPDGSVVPIKRLQRQSGNSFAGTFKIASLEMSLTVFGTFGQHGVFRAAAVDGHHILVLRGTFLNNQDGTATLMLRYRLQTAPGQVDHGTAVLTGTPGAPPTLPEPLF
jgi:hypothetical protein